MTHNLKYDFFFFGFQNFIPTPKFKYNQKFKKSQLACLIMIHIVFGFLA